MTTDGMGWDRHTLPEAEHSIGVFFVVVLQAHTQFAFSNCGGFRLEWKAFLGGLFFFYKGDLGRKNIF
jgi:hypothetical protein